MPFWKAKAHDGHEGEGRRRQSFFDPSHISPERQRRRFFEPAQTPTSTTPFQPSFHPLPVLAGKKHLPQPSGPHSVGFVDMMTSGGPREGSYMRILYPTVEQCLQGHERWPVWKDDRCLSGMLTFMQSVLARWPSWAPRTEYLGMEKLRSISPYLPQSGFPALFRALVGRVYVPILEGAEPLNEPQRKWPLIVFSHGLGCARTTYSRLCYDLASHGFVVAAVDHRDGSACTSYYHDERGERQWIPHKPFADVEDEYHERNHQCHHRVQEVSRVLDVMCKIKSGGFNETVKLVPSGFNFDALAKSVNIDKPVIAGHSFGGCTTIGTLARDKRFGMGIALDPWLFPLRDEDLKTTVDKPLLVICTDSFRSKENNAKIGEMQTCPSGCERVFWYIKGSVHQNYLDAQFLFQYNFLKKITGTMSDTCPEVVMDLSNKLSLQWMWKHLGMPADAEVDSDVSKKKELLVDLFAEEVPPAPKPGWA